jgi:hypothetical protein
MLLPCVCASLPTGSLLVSSTDSIVEHHVEPATAESESVAQVWRHLSVDDRRTLQRQTGRRSIVAHVGRTLATLRQLPARTKLRPPTSCRQRQRAAQPPTPARSCATTTVLECCRATRPCTGARFTVCFGARTRADRAHALAFAGDGQRATTTSCPCTRPSATRCSTATRCGRRTRLVDLASARAATRRLPTDETKRPVVTPRRTVARPRSATADGHSVPRQCSCWHHVAHAPRTADLAQGE